jgi:Mrp family chromosome partitioning ATPase
MSRERESLATVTRPFEPPRLALVHEPAIVELELAPSRGPFDDRVVMQNEPDSSRARSYRLLRHRLLCRSDPRIIAVTSAGAGEGKTTCAVNLAFAIAEDSMTRVLLLDANLLRPALGPLFNVVPSKTVIRNATWIAEVGPPYPVVSILGTRLHVAPLPSEPLERWRLDRTALAVALSDLRDAYDYIVIDAASILESGDVDVVGECSDGAILAARAGRSRKRDIRRALAQLTPVPVLGTALMGS